MEELKPVPAREMLRKAHEDLSMVAMLCQPDERLHPRDYERITKAAAATKLLWEANRGY